VLAAGLSRTRVSVKAALLGQKLVAGPGNIYVDEACWRAEVHPATASNTITLAEAARLRAALIDVLAEGIANGGTTLRDYRALDGSSGDHQNHLDCYGRGGQPCHRCGDVLERAVIADRGTTFCPTCQQLT
jgi:formamidopyrimidine-DNA glycosylase